MNRTIHLNSSLSPESEVLARAENCAAHYTVSTGTGCMVVDAEGNRFSSGKQQEYSVNDICQVCGTLLKTDKDDLHCRQNHLYGSYQAERFGGSYIYFCPISLLHWACPVTRDGMMVGSLIGGPVLVIGPEEIAEEIRRRFKPVEENLKIFMDSLDFLPKTTTERVNSLSEMLFLCAFWVSDIDERASSISFMKKDFLDQQSRISEYIHDMKADRLENEEIPEYPIIKERELLEAISRGNKEEGQKILNEILGTVFFSSGRKFEIIKFRVLELIVLLSRAAMEGGANAQQIFGMNYRFLNEIQKYTNVDDLAFWLSKVLVRFTNLVFTFQDVKHFDAIEKAVRFINSHYTEKITLDQAAAYAQLSPAYFSKIFNDEMKCSFSVYLNNVRIDRSKTLIRNSSYQLVEIAGMVGYEDQSYFTKVFKKVVGISPGKYRERGGKL